MRRDADVGDLGRRGDLAPLPDAAAVGEIGLQDVRRAEREDVAESPFGEEPLAGRDRDRDRRRDLGHRRRVLRQHRLLEEEDVELVERLPPSGPPTSARSRPWQSIRMSTSGPTASRMSRIWRRACAQSPVARRPRAPRRTGSQLERPPAGLDEADARLGDLLRRVAARPVGVEADPVAHPAAEQLVDRDAERLAEDVPQRLLDAGDGAADDHAAAPERVAVDRLPVVLDPRRVLADQVLLDVVDRADDRLGFSFQTGLADAGDPGVGRDLDEDQVRPAGEEDVRDDVGDGEVQVRPAAMPLCSVAPRRVPVMPLSIAYQSATEPSSCQSAGGRPSTGGKRFAASRSSVMPRPGRCPAAGSNPSASIAGGLTTIASFHGSVR